MASNVSSFLGLRTPAVVFALALAVGCVRVENGFNGLALESVFTSIGNAEAVAVITADCGACAWEKAGSEAIVLSISVDGRDPIQLPIVRQGKAEYRVMLGPVSSGDHGIKIEQSADLTAPALRGKALDLLEADIELIPGSDPSARAIALAPIVHARADTVGKFNDVPLLMWYEVEPTGRGERYRYSVIFSNEDGGTPADRLMATWGRTTDIEYIYSVEVDPQGTILSEDMQGPDHEILPFTGKREGRHPLLWVATHNNMVLDHGTTTVRHAPAPIRADLENVSREKVMDDHPWTYEVMAKELAREAKIAANAPTGQGTIPDLRRYVFLEGCGEAGENALTMSVGVKGQWWSSDRGVEQYRVMRNGCFRVAVPLPDGVAVADIDAIRAAAFPRQDKPAGTPSKLMRVNTMFALDDRWTPGPRLAQWQGEAVLAPGGPPFEIKVR